MLCIVHERHEKHEKVFKTLFIVPTLRRGNAVGNAPALPSLSYVCFVSRSNALVICW